MHIQKSLTYNGNTYTWQNGPELAKIVNNNTYQYKYNDEGIRTEKNLMNIGIEFKIINEYGNYLKKILNNIDNTNYIWNITEDEIYVPVDINDGFLFPQEKTTLTNMEFVEIISKESYYTVFANIKLYIKEDEVIINNYEDFIKSSCVLILLITDNEFVEVYSKDENMLEIIYKNAVQNNFSGISYIKKDNFRRKEFSAYSD